MIKWQKSGHVIEITYPNGISVVIREDAITGYTNLDVYLNNKNVNSEVFKLIYGMHAELPLGFVNVDEIVMTKILNTVSNLVIIKGE
jgi:hypothetical protein